MRPPASSKLGAIQPRMVAVVVLLVGLAGLIVLRLSRPPAEGLRVGLSTGASELSRTNLVLEQGRLRQQGSATPFTGLMVERYLDGSLRSRSAVSNGVLQGISKGWYTNGQLQVTEHFKEGVSHGLRTKWYPNGMKQSEADIVEGKLHGSFRKWHENGALSEQVEFVADQPEGVSLAFFPSGFLKARVVMKAGQPAEQKFWKDGEFKP